MVLISITGHATASNPRARSAASSGSACACGRVTIARTSGVDEGHQLGRDLFGIVPAATLDPVAVDCRHESGQTHAVVKGGDRRETDAPDNGDTGSLGFYASPGLGVVGRPDEVLLAGAHLKRERTLSRLRDHLFRIEAVPDLACEVQAVEPAGSEDDRVEPAFAAFSQPRVDVAAQGLDRKCRLERKELRSPPDRSGADSHLRPQLRGAAERVTRVLALEVCPDREAFRIGGRHILGGVNGDVDASVEQRLLELLDEDAASPDLTERAGAIAIPRGRDGYERDLDTRPSQPGRCQLGLREREPTAAGTDADQHGTRCA